MKNIKLIVADWEDVCVNYDIKERNENNCYEKGVDSSRICDCCGKTFLKNIESW